MDDPVGSACDYPAWKPPISLPLVTTPEHPCGYFPDRPSKTRAFWAQQLSGEQYHNLMDAGFRRSGRVVYQPVCRGCRACLPIRVCVGEFMTSKSQRRVWRRNRDLQITSAPPALNEEKHKLYRRYHEQWHGEEALLPDELERFLYDSPLDTLEYCYRDPNGKLLAVGICDLGDNWLSSVYFYFDPDHAKRSLGTYGALREIAEGVQRGMRYYYLGYWVKGCGSMEYKAAFRPHEILEPDGIWRRVAG